MQPRERLVKAAVAAEDLDGSVVDAVLKPEEEVEFPGPHVGVDGSNNVRETPTFAAAVVIVGGSRGLWPWWIPFKKLSFCDFSSRVFMGGFVTDLRECASDLRKRRGLECGWLMKIVRGERDVGMGCYKNIVGCGRDFGWLR
uniref:Uncharacterized protein n=1 Tax=Ananas comosus var. bracteatus TaxID=296719 RepID=A0A6V7PYT0_ANACO|nr:unnamed protein product [Ananas comosus var. bracteatus]